MHPDVLRSELAALLETNSSAWASSTIAYWLSVSAREFYRGSELPPQEAAARLACLNEIQQALARQAKSLLAEGKPAYPSDAFIEAIVERAELGGCVRQAVWALGQTNPLGPQGKPTS